MVRHGLHCFGGTRGGNWLLCRIVVAAATGPFWRKELIERLEAGEKAMGQPCMCGRYGTGEEGETRPDLDLQWSTSTVCVGKHVSYPPLLVLSCSLTFSSPSRFASFLLLPLFLPLRLLLRGFLTPSFFPPLCQLLLLLIAPSSNSPPSHSLAQRATFNQQPTPTTGSFFLDALFHFSPPPNHPYKSTMKNAITIVAASAALATAAATPARLEARASGTASSGTPQVSVRGNGTR